MNRGNTLQKSRILSDLPFDTLDAITKHFFKAKKKNTVDGRGYKRLFKLCQVSKIFYSYFNSRLIELKSSLCTNNNTSCTYDGIGKFHCFIQEQIEYGKVCVRCYEHGKCTSCLEVANRLTDCIHCTRQFCQNGCKKDAFGFNADQICIHCRNDESALDDDDDDNNLDWSSLYSYSDEEVVSCGKRYSRFV